MNDAYKILGVSRNASEDEIKKAYRERARNIQENGGERMSEQMQQLNDAYDAIINERRSSGSNYSYNSGNYNDIRSMIQSGRISEAEQLLDGIPRQNRDAEWYYLKGTLLQRKGWIEDARTHYATAARMDPGNLEYQNAVNMMSGYNNQGGYRTGPAYSGGGGCSACDVCTGLMCTDCCCECMGGDFIRCC